MKQINLTKYGFTRVAEEDFSDDGTRFSCYKVGRIRVTKAVSRGEVYISGSSVKSGKLEYDEYSLLPHYKALDKLNGVALSSVTEADLIQLYNDCVEYEKEYTEKEQSLVFPTEAEIFEALEHARLKYVEQYNDINIIATAEKLFIELSDYDLSWFKMHFKRLYSKAKADSRTKAKELVGKSYSRILVRDRDKDDVYDYNSMLDILHLYTHRLN